MDAAPPDPGSAPAANGPAPAPAYDALWARHGQRLVTLCTRVTGSSAAGRRAAAATFAAVIGADPGPLGPRLALAAAALKACERELGDGVAEPAEPGEPAPIGQGPLAVLVARTTVANAQLAAGDRALLALRLVSNLTHEQIAALTGDESERVAARLAQARLALRAGIGGTAVPAPATGDCERGRALLARRQDGERLSAEDSAWLADHEAGCADCAAARQAMQEADVAYRAWPPEEAGAAPEDRADASTDEFAPVPAAPEADGAAPAPPPEPAAAPAGAERRRRRWFR